MRTVFNALLTASVLVISSGILLAEETVTLQGKDAWAGVTLVGYNPYGNKKSFYGTPLQYKDWGKFTVHSRGSDARKGAEEKTELIKFDLGKLSKKTKIKSARLVLPIQRSAGKKNAVQVYGVLVPWNLKADWKTRDGEHAWEKNGVHGKKDKRLAGSVDVPNEKYDPKKPKELSVDVTDLVKSWASGDAENNGIKLEMTGGYVVIGMKGFRLEITTE